MSKKINYPPISKIIHLGCFFIFFLFVSVHLNNIYAQACGSNWTNPADGKSYYTTCIQSLGLAIGYTSVPGYTCTGLGELCYASYEVGNICGSNYTDIATGKEYTTHCVQSSGTRNIGWVPFHCSGFGEICYKNAEVGKTCGWDPWIDSTGKNHVTFCSASGNFVAGRDLASGYAGCRAGEQCFWNTTPTADSNQFSVQTCTSASGDPGVQTALGCLPVTPNGFSQFFFRIALGVGGGIAFLLICMGGGKIMLSRSDPKALNEGREIFSSAIIGLIIIILSVVFLGIIGVDILGLPGFSR